MMKSIKENEERRKRENKERRKREKKDVREFI